MTICLNMIVKDEAHVIERCLDSVLPLIDTFCIVDTGSTDNTIDVIMDWAERNGIDGSVHERKWVNFAHNRSEAIQLAKGKSDYLLFIDADDILEVKSVQKGLTKDAYAINIVYGEMQYARTCIVKNDGTWRYEGVLHEYPTPDREFEQEVIKGVRMIIVGGGARSLQDEITKYSNDAKVLEEALIEEPNNERYQFYLAQSYRDSRQYEKSMEAYYNRSKMGGFDQEVWFSLYQIGIMAQNLDFESHRIIDYLLQAIDARPSRAEAYVVLASYLNQIDRHGSAYAIAQRAVQLPLSNDVLFVEPEAYTWKAIDQFAIAAYYIGEFQQCVDACNALLTSQYLPGEQRPRIEENRQFALDRLA